MHITPEHIEQTVDAILEVLEACGIPCAGLAQYALRGIKGLRQSAEAKAQLTALLQEAEAEFIQEAIKRGLGNAAGWVHDMPQHDRPAFQQALQRLLQHWDEGALQQLLEQEFAGRPGVSHGEAEAAALYMTILRTYLAHHPDFNRIITTTRILAIDQRTEHMQEQLDTLHGAITVLLGMPADILGWPVEEPPAISELRPYLLHPKYQLIPYTGAPFQEARDDLVKWAQGLDAQEKKVGLRIYTAPGGAGKTRLLIEAGAALRRQGWWAGFLRQGRLDHKNARLLMADTRPTLLILDYAANRQAEAETLLTAAAEAVRERRRDAPLAVVFLERTSPDWLDQLLHRASDPSYVDWVEFLSLPGMERAPRAMPALQTPPERQAFFTTARERLVQYQPAPPPQPITYRAEELPASPLSLSLLALHASAGQRLDQPSDEREILRHTWQREREAWARCLGPWMDEQGVGWAKKAIIDYLERLQVLATLGRPFPDAPSLADFMGQHFGPIRGAKKGDELDLAILVEQLPCVFPRTAGTLIPPIEPDPLADFVLWE
ncbi:MAG: hypothetical protein H5T60_11885, partial [Anaerolineae bacterium]|nr:hypothetical protein [Anaerolineae bacterium]